MNEKIILGVKWIVAFAGAIATNYLGGYDEILELLCWLVVSDFLLGIIISAKNHTFSPLVAGAGFVTKFLYFLVIALSIKTGAAIGKPDTVRNIAVLWFNVSEGASVVENLCLLKVLPEQWAKIFTSAKNGFSIRLIDVIKQLVSSTSIKIGGIDNENK